MSLAFIIEWKHAALGRRDFVYVCVGGELGTYELEVDPLTPCKGPVSLEPVWPWTLARDQPPSSRCHLLSRLLTQLSTGDRKVLIQDGPLLDPLCIGDGFLIHGIYALLDGLVDQGVPQLQNLRDGGHVAPQVPAEVDGLHA